MDFLLNTNGTLKIANGDFATGDSQAQEIEALLMDYKGDWKEFPMVGAAIPKKLKHRAGHTSALKETNLQLTADGFDINTIEIEEQTIRVDAERIN